ncbi:hypothetical protein HDV00_010966 [Rhizophlyctis rosea]|nr:hypothetical protein HDV00_010966 [Rhizophlyctis rosea]
MANHSTPHAWERPLTGQQRKPTATQQQYTVAPTWGHATAQGLAAAAAEATPHAREAPEGLSNGIPIRQEAGGAPPHAWEGAEPQRFDYSEFRDDTRPASRVRQRPRSDMIQLGGFTAPPLPLAGEASEEGSHTKVIVQMEEALYKKYKDLSPDIIEFAIKYNLEVVFDPPYIVVGKNLPKNLERVRPREIPPATSSNMSYADQMALCRTAPESPSPDRSMSNGGTYADQMHDARERRSHADAMQVDQTAPQNGENYSTQLADLQRKYDIRPIESIRSDVQGIPASGSAEVQAVLDTVPSVSSSRDLPTTDSNASLPSSDLPTIDLLAADSVAPASASFPQEGPLWQSLQHNAQTWSDAIRQACEMASKQLGTMHLEERQRTEDACRLCQTEWEELLTCLPDQYKTFGPGGDITRLREMVQERFGGTFLGPPPPVKTAVEAYAKALRQLETAPMPWSQPDAFQPFHPPMGFPSLASPSSRPAFAPSIYGPYSSPNGPAAGAFAPSMYGAGYSPAMPIPTEVQYPPAYGAFMAASQSAATGDPRTAHRRTA